MTRRFWIHHQHYAVAAIIATAALGVMIWRILVTGGLW